MTVIMTFRHMKSQERSVPLWSSLHESLPPVIPGKVDRTTTITADLFLVEITGMEPGISFEVQRVNVLPRLVLPLKLNQCCPSSLCRQIRWPLYPPHVCRERIDVKLICFGSILFTLCITAVEHHGCLKVENCVKWRTCIACFVFLFSNCKALWVHG